MRASNWTEEALATLNRAGLRSGHARCSVVEALGNQAGCLTAMQIFVRLRATGRPVGISSVYRALGLLTERRLVRRIDIGMGLILYEPLQSSHRHHLVCSDCGKVDAFADDALERALRAVSERTGYEVAGDAVVLRGSCPACRR